MKAIFKNEIIGKIKPMHCVNNGPKKEGELSNFAYFKDLEIPFTRNHDASFCSDYGGEHTVDVHMIFPDFSKDPYDPNNYDFLFTDEYTSRIFKANSKVYYRLGTKIEHGNKKYGTIMPTDFKKWAIICEHIIDHYINGWANGFKFNIEYWEIWNEPDGVESNGKPNWSGTDEDYFKFYVIAATHLKKCFPNIKIGGPALSWAGKHDFIYGFLNELTKNGNKTPLDFFSWHSYCFNPIHLKDYTLYIRKTLDDFGYRETEIHVNEYNYLIIPGFKASIPGIIGERGAAFVSSMMAYCQKLPLDMLMYYDCRYGTVWNGVFDFYSQEPLPTYYSLKYFSDVYKLVKEIHTITDSSDLYAIGSKNNDEFAGVLTYFPFDDKCEKVEKVIVDLSDLNLTNVEAKITNDKLMNKAIEIDVQNGVFELELKPNSILLIKGI